MNEEAAVVHADDRTTELAFMYSSRRCKVCMHPDVGRIDEMLNGQLLKKGNEPFTFEEIIDWAKGKGPSLSKAGLSRHREAHLRPRMKAELLFDRDKELQKLVGKMVQKSLLAMMPDLLETVRAEVRREIGQQVKRQAAPRPPAIQEAKQKPLPTAEDIARAERIAVKLKAVQSLSRGEQGKAVEQLAIDHGCTTSTVRNWARLFRDKGVKGLVDHPSERWL